MTVPAPTMITSATERIALKTRLSAGPPRPPETPSTAIAPSSDEIMFANTHGRSRSDWRRSDAYRSAGSTSSTGLGNSCSMNMNTIEGLRAFANRSQRPSCGKPRTYPLEINSSYTFRPQGFVRTVMVLAGGGPLACRNNQASVRVEPEGTYWSTIGAYALTPEPRHPHTYLAHGR